MIEHTGMGVGPPCPAMPAWPAGQIVFVNNEAPGSGDPAIEGLPSPIDRRLLLQTKTDKMKVPTK